MIPNWQCHGGGKNVGNNDPRAPHIELNLEGMEQRRMYDGSKGFSGDETGSERIAGEKGGFG